MVLTHFSTLVLPNSSSIANQLSVMVQAGNLSGNPPNCIILGIWVFDNFISFNELLTKNLQGIVTFLLINSKLCGKLVSYAW